MGNRELGTLVVQPRRAEPGAKPRVLPADPVPWGPPPPPLGEGLSPCRRDDAPKGPGGGDGRRVGSSLGSQRWQQLAAQPLRPLALAVRRAPAACGRGGTLDRYTALADADAINDYRCRYEIV